jgi:hypothetical protein
MKLATHKPQRSYAQLKCLVFLGAVLVTMKIWAACFQAASSPADYNPKPLCFEGTSSPYFPNGWQCTKYLINDSGMGGFASHPWMVQVLARWLMLCFSLQSMAVFAVGYHHVR